MPRHRLPLALLAPIALVILVTALGVLQYRWVGQVSERERDQLRQSLDRRAREFADDFDREISRAYQVFEPEAGFDPAVADRFAKRHDEWQTTPFPGLVKTAYFAQSTQNDYTLYEYRPAERRFEAVVWPAAFAPIRVRFGSAYGRGVPEMASTPAMIAFTSPSIVVSVPAIVIPESRANTVTQQAVTQQAANGIRTAEGSFSLRITTSVAKNYAILALDKPFIASSVLPALVERHFPETGADRFRVAVSAGKDVLFSRGLAAGQTIDPASADAQSGFFGLRLEVFKGMVAGAPVPASAAAATAAAAVDQVAAARRKDTEVQAQRLHVTPLPRETLVLTAPPLPRSPGAGQNFMFFEQSTTAERRLAAPGWTLLLQHEAGSLDAAVAQARRRNLFLSFGILTVLAASAGLVMVNARRSEKLAAQQMEFVATVSHELRTPLAVIRSAAQNLSAGVVHDAGQAQRYGDLIESEGRRLTDMVEQVLEYAGINDAKRQPAPKPMDAVPVLRDVVASFASLPEAGGVDFDVRIDENVPVVMADEAAIRRALHNLIGNALKYARDGRWVGITAVRGQGQDDGFVLVSVADRGHGIAPDELPHVFEPFYRGRAAVEQQIRGNGIGLSLVQQLLQALGGRVTVQSTPGKGATFTLHLPVASGAALTAMAAGAGPTAEPA